MRKNFRNKYRYLKFLLIMIPSLVLWFTLCIYPNLQTIPLSFYKWSSVSLKRTFVGFRNYRTIFNDSSMVAQLRNTLLYVLFFVAVMAVLSLLMALVLQKNTRQNKIFRTYIFLPLTFSSVLVGLTWGFMYDANLGILNNLLTAVGLKSFNGFAWLGTATRGVIAAAVINIWAGLGYPLTFYVAGLQTIPRDLYEAADVEGASPFQTFLHITMPQLAPIFLRLTLLSFIGATMAFDYIYVLGSTLVANSYDTWAVSMFRKVASAGVSENFGIPAALGVMLGLALALIFIIQYFGTKKAEEHAG